MEQRGVVIKLENEYAYVKIRRQSACGSNCASCAGCDTTEQVTKVKNDLKAKVSEQVIIELNTKSLLKAAFLLYIFPLILGFAMGIILFSFSANNALSIISGIIVFIITYYLIYYFNKKFPVNEQYLGHIKGIFS